MLNPTTLRTLTTAIDGALEAVALQYGVTIACGNVKYSALEATIKLEVTANAGKEVREEAARAAAFVLGLPKDTIGKEFTFRGRSYKVTGIDLKRPKFPISADRIPDGKAFKFPADALLPPERRGRQYNEI